MSPPLRLQNGQTVQVFVAHVKVGYEDRARHIDAHLGALGVPFEYLLDGDIPDLDPGRLETYFTGEEMKRPSGITSCAMKHLLVYEEIVRRDLPGALVLEDDIFLTRDFLPVFAATLDELARQPDRAAEPALISYENSSLRFVPPEELVPGQHLYARDRGRCTGAYWVNRAGAESMLRYTRAHRCHRPIDHYHNHLVAAGALRIYWCHPAIAEQGSHSGVFGSAIDERRTGFLRRAKWLVQKLYKQNFRAYRRG